MTKVINSPCAASRARVDCVPYSSQSGFIDKPCSSQTTCVRARVVCSGHTHTGITSNTCLSDHARVRVRARHMPRSATRRRTSVRGGWRSSEATSTRLALRSKRPSLRSRPARARRATPRTVACGSRSPTAPSCAASRGAKWVLQRAPSATGRNKSKNFSRACEHWAKSPFRRLGAVGIPGRPPPFADDY